MTTQNISAILLSVPIITMLIPGINFWLEFRNSRKTGRVSKKANYKKLFFYLLVAGVLCMWVSWIGGIIFLFLNKFYSIFGFLTFLTNYDLTIQIIGLIIFYAGAITYNLNIIFAGKNLCPVQFGITEDHKLIQNGPFGIIRHPLYVSYILILAGLSLTFLIYWILVPALFIIIGIYPTAKAEEETLIEQFGEEYIEYKRKVGMFFPKFKRR